MHSRLGRVGWLGLALLALASVLVPATATASDHKRYSVGVPAKALPKSLQHLTVTLENGAVDQSLGSADITSPFAVTQGSATLSSASGGSVTTEGNVLKLRGLNLPPGQALAVKFDATTPDPGVGCESQTYTWKAQAKQANDFKGVGNDFLLSNGPLETTVNCKSDLDEAKSVFCAYDQSCSVTIAYFNSPAVELTATILPGDEGTDGHLSAKWQSIAKHTCASQAHKSPVSGVVVGPDGRNKIIALKLSPEIVETGSTKTAEQLLAEMDVCGGVPVTPWVFKDDLGVFDHEGLLWYQGLIGDCGDAAGTEEFTPFRPCLDRTAGTGTYVDETGNYTTTAYIPGIPGDPAYR